MDGLRAISIAGVLLAHAHGTDGFPKSAWVELFGDLGNLGVRVFFVISGFLITHLLLAETQATGRISLRGFFIRRAFRIFPAFYTFLGGLLVFWLAGGIALSWADLFYGATYTINFVPKKSWVVGHLWSLAVEEQFYLLWPCCIVALGWRRAIWLAGAAVLLAPVLRIGAWYGLPGEYRPIIGKAFPTICDTIATGCLLACFRERLWSSEIHRRLLGSGWFLAGLVTVVLLSNSLASHTRPDMLAGQSVRNIGIALGIDWFLRNRESLVARFLNLPALAVVGTMSYSLYLWQQVFLNRSSTEAFAGFPQNIFLAVLFAALSFYVIERPMLRCRSRFMEPKKGRGIVAAAEQQVMPGVA